MFRAIVRKWKVGCQQIRPLQLRYLCSKYEEIPDGDEVVEIGECDEVAEIGGELRSDLKGCSKVLKSCEAFKRSTEDLLIDPKFPLLTCLEVIDKERCKLVSGVTDGVVKLSIQARFHGILVGPSYEATGFIISDSGHFVTNVHCISEACLTTKGSLKRLQAEVFVTWIGKRRVRLRARVLLGDSGIDLALCQIVIPTGISFHVFEFGYAVPRVGQSIFTLGSASSCANTSRFGFVADVGFSVNDLTEEDCENVVVSREYVPKNFEYILLDLNAASGFSGGPSCDVKGRVIAINQSTSSGDHGYFNLAVPVKYLVGLMLKHIKLGLRGYVNGDGLFDIEGADEDDHDDEDDYEDEDEFVSDEESEVD